MKRRGFRRGAISCASIAVSKRAAKSAAGVSSPDFSGEQFALPEAVGKLREVRREKDSSALVSLSGADPLNLVGIITPGPKLAALTGNRVLYRDGTPLAIFAGQEVQFLRDARSERRMGRTQGAAAFRGARSIASRFSSRRSALKLSANRGASPS